MAALTNMNWNNDPEILAARNRKRTRDYEKEADELIKVNPNVLEAIPTGMITKTAGALAAGLMANTTSQLGSSEANKGFLGHLQPFYVIKRKMPYPSDRIGIGHYIGKPSREYVEKLGNLSGFTRCLEVNVSSTSATTEEKRIIEAYLKKGVYL